MKKLWLICLLLVPLQLRANCPEADKYKFALDKCGLYLDALKNENTILVKNVNDAQSQTSQAIKMASDQNWGIPAEVWLIGGLLAGTGLGIFLGRSLK